MSMSKKQLSEQIKQLSVRKEQLLKLKASEQLSEQEQQELDSIAENLFDLEEQLEKLDSNNEPKTEPKAESKAEPKAQPKVEPKTESKAQPKKKLADEQSKDEVVILELLVGKRYDADTGKEVNHPFRQTYNWSEWQNFKKYYGRCGYKIINVVNDPWGDAAALLDATNK